MFSNNFLVRLMSRTPKKTTWEPPPKKIWVLRTKEKRPMGMPIDFRCPITPGRKGDGERRLVMRFQNWGCKNRPFLRIIVSKDSLPQDRQSMYSKTTLQLLPFYNLAALTV